MRQLFGSYRVAIETFVVVAILVGIRELLCAAGVTGISASPLASSIVAGGVFVMGLVVAGTLSDYRDAERAPTDLAAGLYAILRECESMNAVWNKPDLSALRQRLIAIVTTLRGDINAGNTRECQAALEELSGSFLELEESDVPANYVVRLRQEQAGLRKSLLRASDDDVSLFLLNEFVVHANAAGSDAVPAEDVTAQAEALEELMLEVEEQADDGQEPVHEVVQEAVESRLTGHDSTS